MADVQIEGLEFDISADSGKASQSLNGLISTLQSLKSAIKGNGLKSMANSLSAISNIKISDDTINSINRLADSLKNLTSISSSLALKDVARIIRAQNKVPKVNPTTQNVDSTTPKESDVETSSGGIQEAANSAGRLAGILGSIKSGAASAGNAIKNALGSVGSSALNKLKSSVGSVASELGKLTKQAVKIGGGVLLSPIQAPIKALGSLKEQFASASKAVTGLLRSFGRIAMYRAIRFFFSQLTGAIKEGINNLYQYSSLMGGTFKGSMDSLASSFQYLKNSMGAMVAPIINAIAPAVDYLIGKFVALLNIINQFFARLSGASFFTRAKKQAVSYGSAVGGAGKAAKQAAKDIKDATTGIDELNIIQQKDNANGGSGGGGGASTPDYGSMFEKVPIDSGIKDFTDKLKAAIDKGDWKSVGTLLGNKFNELVDSVDWNGFGKKVGYGINGAVQSAYWFLKTADFKKLGNHIASFLNGAMSEIDFSFVGRLLVRGVTAGLDLLIGFLGGLDWGLVGKSLGDFLKGAFDEAYEWITSYDWGKMADSVYKNLKKFLLGIDFAGVARSFFRALGAALGAAVSFIGTFVADVATDIIKYFKQYINTDGDKHWWEIGADIIKGIFEGIWNAIKNIGNWIYDNVFKPFIDGFKAAFGIHSPSTVMKEQGGYIIDGLLEGLLKFPKKIAKTVKEWGKNLIDWFTGGDGNGNIVDKFKQKASDIVGGFRDKVGSTYTTVKTNVSNWAKGVKDWFGEHVNVSNWQQSAGDIISGFKDKVGSTYTTVKSNVTTWAQGVRDWFSGSSYGDVNSNRFSTFAGNVIEGFKTKIGNAYTNTKSGITTWASNVKEWFSGSSYGDVNSSRFSTFANNVIEGFRTKIGNAYTNTRSNMQTWANNVKNWFSNIASNTAFGTFATNVINGFKDKIGKDYTTAKSSMTTFANSVKSWFEKPDGTSLVDKFKDIGSNVIQGFINGVNSLWDSAMRRIKEFGRSIISKGKEGTEERSPSRAFRKIGAFVIEGFNLGLEDVIPSSYRTMSQWTKNISSYRPQVAFAVDGSALTAYDPTAYVRNVSADVNTQTSISVNGLQSSMEDFYKDYIEPTFVRMADDVKRQADKSERTVVQIGNRVITDEVNRQKKANGYNFTD